MATTEQVGSSVEQIPYVALEQLGKIFFEGQNKYGVGNWKDNPSPSYRLERLRHAIRHLFLFAEHDDTEKHLAKVLWFCVTELYLETKHGPLRAFSSRELYPDAKHKEPEAEPKRFVDKLLEETLDRFEKSTAYQEWKGDLKHYEESTKINPESQAFRNCAHDSSKPPFNSVPNSTDDPVTIISSGCGSIKIGTNPPKIEVLNTGIGETPTVPFEAYQKLQIEFESYKIYAKKEFKILHEEIKNLISQKTEANG